jgi:hypothetical protein
LFSSWTLYPTDTVPRIEFDLIKKIVFGVFNGIVGISYPSLPRAAFRWDRYLPTPLSKNSKGSIFTVYGVLRFPGVPESCRIKYETLYTNSTLEFNILPRNPQKIRRGKKKTGLRITGEKGGQY